MIFSLFVYVASTVLAIAVIMFVPYLFPDHQSDSKAPVEQIVFRMDARWYLSIAQYGYDYDPNARSNVAFFPAYPLVSHVICTSLRIRQEAALLLVSNLCLLGCFICLGNLSVEPDKSTASPPTSPAFTLATFACWPTAFFFHIAYSESMFMFSAMLALQRGSWDSR